MTLHSRFHAQGGARVLFANKIFKIYLLMVLSLIRELRFNVSVNQTCQPPENSKREIARNSDVSTKLACNLRARFKTYKISRREIFSSGGRFFAAFQKDNTCYWQKKRSIPLAFTDTLPIKQGKIETVSYLRY